MKIQRILLPAVVAGLLVCGTASAEEDQVSGTGSSATVHLDFRVVVPGVLRFRVGSAGSTINLVEFDPTVSDLQNGNTSVAGSFGDLGNGQVSVEVFTNRGGVEISESNDGGGTGLQSTGGGTDTISYGRIATASVNGDIPPPTLSDAGGNTSSVGPTGGNVNITDASDVWEYTFDASNLDVAPDTYEGRVTYTAATP